MGLESTLTTMLMYFQSVYVPFKFKKGKQYLCLTVLAFQCSQQNWGFALRSITPREDNRDLCCCSVLLDAWWIFIMLIRGQKVEWEEGGTICLFPWDKSVSFLSETTRTEPQVNHKHSYSEQMAVVSPGMRLKKSFSQICLANNQLRRTYL